MRQYNVVSDLVLVRSIEPVVYKQYDNGDTLEVELYQDNEKIALTNENVLAFFQLEDVNKTVIQKTCAISNGNAIATLDNNILSVGGKVKVEFTIYDGDKQTTTRTLLITVETSIDRNAAIETVPQWDIVSQILVEGAGVIAAAKQATEDALEAVEFIIEAIGDVGIAIDGANQAAQNANDKASLADASATNANDKATLANDAATNADNAKDAALQAKEDTELATTNAVDATNAINIVLPNVVNLEFVEVYNPISQYKKNNIVRLGKNSYIALQDTLGNEPTGTTDSVYWGVIAIGGVDGLGSVVSVNGESPDENGNVVLNIATSWNELNDKPTEFPPTEHPISKVTGLQTKLNEFTTHWADNTNPHKVTAAQVGAVAKVGDQTIDGSLSAKNFSCNTNLLYDDAGLGIRAGGTGVEKYFKFNNNGNFVVLNGSFQFGSGIVLSNGAGSPEGFVVATVGSLYLRADGGITSSLYVKTSGTGNTGWTVK